MVNAVDELPPTDGQLVLDTSFMASPVMYNWMRAVSDHFRTGLSVTITTAKLTPGGANGSMTFVNGILTAQTPAT